jgi:sodium/hydrogen exchanger-like protein 6/7
MFAVLAQLSENFIFIYLGLNLFTQDVQVFKPLFIAVSAVSQIAACDSDCADVSHSRSP